MKKVSFPTATGARAAYRVLFIQELDKAWDTVVDAQSGAVLSKQSLVQHEAEGTVYENFPGAPKGGTPVVKSFGPTAESPSGYVDPTGVAGLAGPTTLGNNASTYANYSNFLVPADQGPRPVSPTSQFNYTYDMNWQKTKGATVPRRTRWTSTRPRPTCSSITTGSTTSSTTSASPRPPATSRPTAATRCSAWCTRVPASGGAPTYTGRDNAYMLTLPDGVPPWSGMFLWEPINDAFEGPYSDGNFDASVIEHEYAHGLSTRYVAGGELAGRAPVRLDG